MRSLYFDLDGTILVLNKGEPKAALADGKLEAAIRLKLGREKYRRTQSRMGIVTRSSGRDR